MKPAAGAMGLTYTGGTGLVRTTTAVGPHPIKNSEMKNIIARKPVNFFIILRFHFDDFFEKKFNKSCYNHSGNNVTGAIKSATKKLKKVCLLNYCCATQVFSPPTSSVFLRSNP